MLLRDDNLTKAGKVRGKSIFYLSRELDVTLHACTDFDWLHTSSGGNGIPECEGKPNAVLPLYERSYLTRQKDGREFNG